ncbi:acetyltransferase [Laspinema olomoucense]|uniref:acetyltransferase n=1 Tax=Laspinema olomoucense TaxID=3231600 RepID=UPI0021BB65CB|nr:acetyltransferase [Laspinema sp. D3c]MCT7995217.1 acetyltransferase [Laspinema sp. D3c]
MNLNHHKFIIWGSSGHSKVLSSLIRQLGGIVIALFDNNPDAQPSLKDVPLYRGIEGFNEWLLSCDEPSKVRGIAAIGGSRGKDRLDIHNLFISQGIQVETLIHPNASICNTSRIARGSQLLSLSLVASDSIIGEACILNHRASVDHDCVVGNGIHLAPASTLCGCVTLGDNVMVGAGAVVLPRLTVGKNTIIGAGSVVTKDLPENVVVFGNPAKVMKSIQN